MNILDDAKATLADDDARRIPLSSGVGHLVWNVRREPRLARALVELAPLLDHLARGDYLDRLLDTLEAVRELSATWRRLRGGE